MNPRVQGMKELGRGGVLGRRAVNPRVQGMKALGHLHGDVLLGEPPRAGDEARTTGRPSTPSTVNPRVQGMKATHLFSGIPATGARKRRGPRQFGKLGCWRGPHLSAPASQ